MDPDELPLTLLREADGTPALVSLPLPDGHTLSALIKEHHPMRLDRRLPRHCVTTIADTCQATHMTHIKGA